MKKKHYTIPVFIPELACPHQCVFCNQRKISGSIHVPNLEEVKSTIDQYLETLPDSGADIDVGFLGGNFTGIPLKEQEDFLKVAFPYLKAGRVSGIRLSTRPDYINDEVIELMERYGVTTIELGAQSMDMEVLEFSGRGHTIEHIIHASRMIKDAGIELGLQMMCGLPGDTPEKSLDTAKQIIALGADNTRIYPALVIKDTALAEMYEEKSYSALSLEEAVEWVKPVFLEFEKHKVDIIRVGLHPSEGLMNGSDLFDGPFHISFRELVLTSIWCDLFSDFQFDNDKELVEITVPMHEYNYAIGYHASNKKMLMKKFKQVRFISDELMNDRSFHVRYC